MTGCKTPSYLLLCSCVLILESFGFAFLMSFKCTLKWKGRLLRKNCQVLFPLVLFSPQKPNEPLCYITQKCKIVTDENETKFSGIISYSFCLQKWLFYFYFLNHPTSLDLASCSLQPTIVPFSHMLVMVTNLTLDT